ncbi:MAG: hypothetical protein NT165_00345 [Candidatus Falkowbacteria bacterium]|nr:hypothetical protein [Candidatus Falkowbacteria bacterium]
MLKSRKFAIFVIALLISLTLKAQKADLFDFKIGFSTNQMNASHVSEDFRNVPIHPDDGSGPSGVIAKADYSVPFFLSLDFLYKHKFEGGIIFGGGLTLGCHFADLEERNYTNAPGTSQRGYGAALTYCGVIVEGPLGAAGVHPLINGMSVLPKLIFEVPIKKSLSFSLAASYQAFSAINGWDRFDDKECNETKVLAHLFPLDASLRFNFSGWGLELGSRYLITSLTGTGKDFGTKISPFGVYVGFSLNTKVLE